MYKKLNCTTLKWGHILSCILRVLEKCVKYLFHAAMIIRNHLFIYWLGINSFGVKKKHFCTQFYPRGFQIFLYMFVLTSLIVNKKTNKILNYSYV